MRYLYYCNSTYQMLNAINLHINRKLYGFDKIDNYSGDILLLNVFKGCKEIGQILEENRIFDRIFIGNRVYKKGRFHLIRNILDIIFPANFIYKANGIKKEELYDKYDCIVVPKFSTITAAIWRMNKRAKLQIYEDGLGTYSENISLSPNSGSYKALYKFFNYGRTFYDYEYLFLNNTDLFCGKNCSRIRKIPTMNTNREGFLIEKFSNFLFDINSDKRIIWFDQYIKDDINDSIRKLLAPYSKDVIYCTHPRHPKNYEEFDKPNPKQIWELACLELEDIDSKYLLTIYSTAVFTPKILYDFEPNIIFTLKLLNDYNEEKYSMILKTIERFKTMYSDESKIFIPETMEELKVYVNNLINSK